MSLNPGIAKVALVLPVEATSTFLFCKGAEAGELDEAVDPGAKEVGTRVGMAYDSKALDEEPP